MERKGGSPSPDRVREPIKFIGNAGGVFTGSKGTKEPDRIISPEKICTKMVWYMQLFPFNGRRS